MARLPAVAPDDAPDDTRLARYRRLLIGVLILAVLGSLAIETPGNHGISVGARWFLLAGTVIFAVLAYVLGLLPSTPTLRPAPWIAITAILGLALTLFVVGGPDWLAVPAVAAGCCGSPLTDREGEVLAAAASHDAIADIAARLHLSPGTVRNHLSAAIQKLGARNRAEAVQIAQQKGWL
jgi:DNA-binding CsgD family transcriptional regulator